MSLDPGELVASVDEGAGRLEVAADQLTEAINAFERIENEYELAMAKARVAAQVEYEADGKKIAADLRNDIALTGLDPELRLNYAEAKAHKEALSARYRALAAAISARQSLLRYLSGAGG